MQPKILVAGCDSDHLDAVVDDLAKKDITVHYTTSPNQIRTTYDEFRPEVIVVSAGVPDPMRHSIESLIHEVRSGVTVHWQPREGLPADLQSTVQNAVDKWLGYNAR